MRSTDFGAGDAQKAYAHQHSCDGNLVVAEFDSVKILDR